MFLDQLLRVVLYHLPHTSKVVVVVVNTVLDLPLLVSLTDHIALQILLHLRTSKIGAVVPDALHKAASSVHFPLCLQLPGSFLLPHSFVEAILAKDKKSELPL